MAAVGSGSAADTLSPTCADVDNLILCTTYLLVVNLKTLCAHCGLKRTGRKSELIDRLTHHIRSVVAAGPPQYDQLRKYAANLRKERLACGREEPILSRFFSSPEERSDPLHPYSSGLHSLSSLHFSSRAPLQPSTTSTPKPKPVPAAFSPAVPSPTPVTTPSGLSPGTCDPFAMAVADTFISATEKGVQVGVVEVWQNRQAEMRFILEQNEFVELQNRNGAWLELIFSSFRDGPTIKLKAVSVNRVKQKCLLATGARIDPHALFCGKNRLELSVEGHSGQRVGTCSLRIRRVQATADIISRLRASTVPSEEAKKAIVSRMTDAEEVASLSTTLSLQCPLSCMRLRTPGRGRACTHVQCFDLGAFLDMNRRAPRYSCPLCTQPTTPSSLVVDGFFEGLLRTPTFADANEVEIMPDGSCHLPQPPSSRKRGREPTPPENVVELLSDDGDGEPSAQRHRANGSGVPSMFLDGGSLFSIADAGVANTPQPGETMETAICVDSD